MGLGNLPGDIIIAIADRILDGNIKDDRPYELSSPLIPLIAHQLQSINRNWRDAVMHSHLYSANSFFLRNASEARKIKTWLTPARKATTLGRLTLEIDDWDLYSELSQDNDGLAELSTHCFSLTGDVWPDVTVLPRNLKAREVYISNDSFTATPVVIHSFSASLCDHLRLLDLFNVSFEGVEELESSNFSFKSLKKLTWINDDPAFKNSRKLLQLMPNLEVLDVTYIQHYNSSGQNALFEFPRLMPALKILFTSHLLTDLNECTFPKLQISCISSCTDLRR